MANTLKMHRYEVSKLEPLLIPVMFELYARYYDEVSLTQFEVDLACKKWVLLLYADDALVGFSTVDVRVLMHETQNILELFSGDTVVAPEHWGSQLLSTGFSRLAGFLAHQHPSCVVYWLLISKGYRTWRYLSLFAREYWPNHGRSTPASYQKLQDALAAHRFGANYDATRGIVRFAHSHGHLQSKLAGVRDNLLQKPEIEFFLKKNPGYIKGDELVCLTRLHPDNLRGVVLRGFNEGWSEASSQ